MRLIEKALVNSVELTRYAVDGDRVERTRPVLTTHGLVAFVDKGVSTWSLDLSGAEAIRPARATPPHVAVTAEWLDTQQALERGVKLVHGGSANSFGGMGALLLPDDFEIPAVVADAENVRHYGLRLIDDGADFSISSPRYQLAMMRYRYSRDYRRDFLMQPGGGGGLFVETHDFPHIHIPLSEACGGHIVIGKAVGADEYHFTAFQIPFGHALYTPSNTIHGDGTLTGEYALTVADSAYCHADTVLMYDRSTLSVARDVVPHQTDPSGSPGED